MDRVFARMWIAAGRATQLTREGAFLRRDVAGASVLIVRGAEGAMRAFYNVCRHRGTRLCTESDGVFRGSIQCPYHAWTYALDGRLVTAPQMDEVAGFDRADYPLREVACETWDGHIFINLADSPAPLAAQLGELPQRFAPWAMQDLQLGNGSSTTWRRTGSWWCRTTTNACTVPVIHPLLNRMHHYLGAENVPSSETLLRRRDGLQGRRRNTQHRRPAPAGLPAWRGGRDRSLVHYFAIYPNLLLTLHPDYMTTVTIWPQDCGRTKLIAEWHFHPDEIAKPDFVFEDAVEFWDRTNREDWAISEQSYLGISSRGYVPGPYSEREKQLWEFDQFILSRLNADTETQNHGITEPI